MMHSASHLRYAIRYMGALALLIVITGLLANNVGAQSDKKDTDARILFVSDRDTSGEFAIYAMNPDGTGQTRISKGKGIAFDPAWSPDHKQIAYSFVANKDMPKSDLMVMKADGSEPTRLVAGEEKTLYLSPSWSSDGKHIVYSATATGNDKFESALYVVDADGKNKKKLGEGMLPAWSADGKQIFFSAGVIKDGPPELKVMNADGTDVKPRTPKGLGLSFSPDGKHIALTAEGGDRPNVFVMDTDGSHLTQLTKDPDSMALGPVWASDGKHILFTKILREEGGGKPRFQICQMDADGSNVKSLTKEDSFVGSGPSLFFLLRSMGQL